MLDMGLLLIRLKKILRVARRSKGMARQRHAEQRHGNAMLSKGAAELSNAKHRKGYARRSKARQSKG
jgi:hypothetical protein